MYVDIHCLYYLLFFCSVFSLFSASTSSYSKQKQIFENDSSYLILIRVSYHHRKRCHHTCCAANKKHICHQRWITATVPGMLFFRFHSKKSELLFLRLLWNLSPSTDWLLPGNAHQESAPVNSAATSPQEFQPTLWSNSFCLNSSSQLLTHTRTRCHDT